MRKFEYKGYILGQCDSKSEAAKIGFKYYALTDRDTFLATSLADVKTYVDLVEASGTAETLNPHLGEVVYKIGGIDIGRPNDTDSTIYPDILDHELQ
jgi:hypothetical protein